VDRRSRTKRKGANKRKNARETRPQKGKHSSGRLTKKTEKSAERHCAKKKGGKGKSARATGARGRLVGAGLEGGGGGGGLRGEEKRDTFTPRKRRGGGGRASGGGGGGENRTRGDRRGKGSAQCLYQVAGGEITEATEYAEKEKRKKKKKKKRNSLRPGTGGGQSARKGRHEKKEPRQHEDKGTCTQEKFSTSQNTKLEKEAHAGKSRKKGEWPVGR